MENNFFNVELESWDFVKDSETGKKILLSHLKDFLQQEAKWEFASDKKEIKDNLGIGTIHPMYIEVNDIQDPYDELKKINKFIYKYIESKYQLNGVKKEFINYGKTELVYVMTLNDKKRITLLVKQPAIEFGKVKKEAEILLELNKKNEKVIEPFDYFSYGEYELYTTEYINQARCVASDDAWGMYVPEPFYRFEKFTKEQAHIVNTCMIAKLISLYDFEKQEGLSACKLGGGDFILLKGWELEEPTLENTLDNLYLIAAREKICCSFEEYLTIIRNEFLKRTIDNTENNIKINIRGRVPMKPKDIEEGIMLGKELIKNSNGKNKIRKK